MSTNNKLLKLGISAERYLELKYFCLQYRRMKAQQTARYEEYAKIIEQCVIAACEPDCGLYAPLLQNVAEGTKYECLSAPCGRRQFYEKRALFFELLDKLKH